MKSKKSVLDLIFKILESINRNLWGFNERFMNKKSAFITIFILLLGIRTHGSDWPQWRGPGRDGIWHEKGIIEKFEAPQINIRWRAKRAT